MAGAILLVEDEPLVRMAVRHHLERLGYAVLEAGSSEQALALARRSETPIGLLIADIFLPGTSGADLARQVAPDRDLPCLYISAHPRDLAIRKGWIPSDAVLLQKPFSNEALAATVQQVLREPVSAG